MRSFAYDKNKKMIWVLDKENKSITPRSIEITCSRKYYYSHKSENSEWNHDLEKYLGTHETSFWQCIQKVKRQVSNIFSSTQNINLENTEKEQLYKFIMLQALRVPKKIDQICEELFLEYLKSNKKFNIQETKEETINSVKKAILPRLLGFEHDSLLSLIRRKQINIVRIPEGVDSNFITGDNPVLITNPDKSNALIESNTECAIPISPKIAIAIHGSHQKPQYVNFNSVKNINRVNSLFAEQATKFIIAQREKDLHGFNF